MLERYDDALASADRALELAPDSAHAWRQRGCALAELEQTEEALTAFAKAGEFDLTDTEP